MSGSLAHCKGSHETNLGVSEQQKWNLTNTLDQKIWECEHFKQRYNTSNQLWMDVRIAIVDLENKSWRLSWGGSQVMSLLRKSSSDMIRRSSSSRASSIQFIGDMLGTESDRE